MTRLLRHRKCLTFFTAPISTWFMKYCLLNFFILLHLRYNIRISFLSHLNISIFILRKQTSQFFLCSLHDAVLNLLLLFNISLILSVYLSAGLPACLCFVYWAILYYVHRINRPHFTTEVKARSSTRSPFVTLLSRRAQSGRWKLVWFTESHLVLVIFFFTCVLFILFILDIK